MKDAHIEHILALKANNIPVVKFIAACCGATIETRANTDKTKNWDEFCQCPNCNHYVIKVTFSQQDGAYYEPIQPRFVESVKRGYDNRYRNR